MAYILEEMVLILERFKVVLKDTCQCPEPCVKCHNLKTLVVKMEGSLRDWTSNGPQGRSRLWSKELLDRRAEHEAFMADTNHGNTTDQL